jgi:serine/threonine-protein kinase HipA
MLRWAAEVGIEVPEIQLVPVSFVAGLPPEVGALPEQQALAIKRFDRGNQGARIHIEDFAQVRNVYPNRKYKDGNYETVGRIVYSLTGAAGFEEFLRRLVFNVAIGNGDAHLKNWSLIYRDGVRAELAPAYDLVATVLYMAEDELALNLAKSKRFEDVSLPSFRRLAEKAEFEGSRAEEIVRSTVARVRETWRRLSPDLPLADADKQRIETRWQDVPLMSS